jgi:hypothetical protein
MAWDISGYVIEDLKFSGPALGVAFNFLKTYFLFLDVMLSNNVWLFILAYILRESVVHCYA